MTLYDRIKKIAELRNITISGIEEAVDISNGSIAKWKQNIPKADNLYKVAKYLKCSMEFLLTGACDMDTDSDSEIKNSEYLIREPDYRYSLMFNENELELLYLLHKFNDDRSQIKFIARVEDIANEMLTNKNKK